jgi:hypothetical protein
MRSFWAIIRNALAFIVFMGILLAFNAESPAQQVYKYVDKNGVTHFTNTPTDPRYKSAPRTLNPKAPKKHKRLKSGKYSGSIPSKQVGKANQPPVSNKR